MKLLCKLGFHRWSYAGTKRDCRRCGRVEYLRYSMSGEYWFEWGKSNHGYELPTTSRQDADSTQK